MKRAIRRHHKERMKAKARRLFKGTKCPDKYADHLAVCSCWMCGNPRHSRFGSRGEKVTLQEKEADRRYREQLRELEK